MHCTWKRNGQDRPGRYIDPLLKILILKISIGIMCNTFIDVTNFACFGPSILTTSHLSISPHKVYFKGQSFEDKMSISELFTIADLKKKH